MAGQPASLTEAFKGITLTDQNGNAFDPAKQFANGECVVLFGYGGCPMCQNITQTVAVLQEKMEKSGKHVPIIVVSVQPEKDSAPDKRKEYIESYAEMKVHETDAEGRRVLHVVCPKSAEDAKTIQTRLGLPTSENAKQHSSLITLFKNGAPVKQLRGLTEKNDFNPEHAEKVSGEFLKPLEVKEAPKVETPAPPPPKPDQTNTWLNIGVPAGVGILTTLFTGGFSGTGILAGLLAAGVASVATQYFTKTGFFGEKPAPQVKPEKPAEKKTDEKGVDEPTKGKPLSPEIKKEADQALARPLTGKKCEIALGPPPPPPPAKPFALTQ